MTMLLQLFWDFILRTLNVRVFFVSPFFWYVETIYYKWINCKTVSFNNRKLQVSENAAFLVICVLDKEGKLRKEGIEMFC
jgi:hypothetical protein